MAVLKSTAVIVSLATSIVIGYINFRTADRWDFSLVYILPVMFLTRYAGRYTGYGLALISTVIWFVAEFHAYDADYTSYTLYWNATVRLILFIIIVYFLANRESEYKSERFVARTDPLTGARNRRAFDEILAKEVSRQERSHRPFSLAFIDCDGFKAVNDSLGHKTGDRLLQTVSDTMRASMRGMDVFARLGGDEFAILMPETEQEAADGAMQRIRKIHNDTMQANGWSVTLSIGLATFLKSPSSAEDALQKADALMYKAKERGKDRIVQAEY